MHSSASDRSTSATPQNGELFPGWGARLVIALSLVALVVVRLVSRSNDPPFPLNDPAIGNLLTLGFGFIAICTTWVWFFFNSGYSLAAKRAVMIAPLVIIFGALGTVMAVGFNRIFQLDGSMGLRLAPLYREPGSFQPAAQGSAIDLN